MAIGFFKYFQENFTEGLLELLNQPGTRKRELALKKIQGDPSNIATYQFEDIEYKKIKITPKGIDEIEFGITVALKVCFQTKMMSYCGKFKHTFTWCDLVFRATIGDDVENVRLLRVLERNEYAPERLLADDLVPVLHKEDYEETAIEILKAYMPEALNPWWNGDISSLPDRMGINCILAPLSTEEKRIFGAIVFKKKPMNVFVISGRQLVRARAEVMPNTILIDPTVVKGKNSLAFNLTIAHECIHYYLHKKAIRFAMILNKTEDFFDYLPTKETKTGDGNFMESQASGISYYLAMPTPSFTLLLNALYRRTASRNRGYLPLESISINMSLIAKRFSVSKNAVRTRMVLAGHHEAKGCSDYADGQYLPPTFCAEGVLDQNEEFAISSQQVRSLLLESELFRTLIRSGEYTFADNRIVLRHSRYLKQSPRTGIWHMSDYARLHPQECCLIFRIKRQSGASFSLAEAAESSMLARQGGINLNYDAEIIRHPKIVLQDDFAANRLFNKRAIEEVLDYMEGKTFAESLRHICELVGLRNKDLEFKTGIDAGNISHYLKGEKQPSVEHFAALCIALNVCNDIVEALYSKASCKFLDNEIHKAIRESIQLLSGQSKDFVDRYFLSMGLQPLVKRINEKTSSCPSGSSLSQTKPKK